MICKACEEFQDSDKSSFFRWKSANVEVRACEEHLREVFDALRKAQAVPREALDSGKEEP